jgi:hypothetical protein
MSRFEDIVHPIRGRAILDQINPASLRATTNCPSCAACVFNYLETGNIQRATGPLGGSTFLILPSSGMTAGGFRQIRRRVERRPNYNHLAVEGTRTPGVAAQRNITRWHYFNMVKVGTEVYVIDAFLREVFAGQTAIENYLRTRLYTSSYMYSTGNFQVRPVMPRSSGLGGFH